MQEQFLLHHNTAGISGTGHMQVHSSQLNVTSFLEMKGYIWELFLI